MSPHAISISPAWTAGGWTMIHLVWIGAVGGLGVALLRRLLRPARPEIRHGVAIACHVAVTGGGTRHRLCMALRARIRDACRLRALANRITPADPVTLELAPPAARDPRCWPIALPTTAPSRRPVSSPGQLEPLVVYLPVRLAFRLAGDARPARDRLRWRQTTAAVVPAAGDRQDRPAVPGARGLSRDRSARRRGDLRPDRRAPILIGVIRPC